MDPANGNAVQYVLVGENNQLIPLNINHPVFQQLQQQQLQGSTQVTIVHTSLYYLITILYQGKIRDVDLAAAENAECNDSSASTESDDVSTLYKLLSPLL